MVLLGVSEPIHACRCLLSIDGPAAPMVDGRCMFLLRVNEPVHACRCILSIDGPAAPMVDELENSGASMGLHRLPVGTVIFLVFFAETRHYLRAPRHARCLPYIPPLLSSRSHARRSIRNPIKNRNGGFGTFLRVFYASLERRRQASPSVAAVAFGGSDDEWASLQVRYTTVNGCMRAGGID